MKERILDELIGLFSHYKEPMFISNSEIIEFFRERKDEITYDVFLHIRDYYLVRLNVPRKAFIVLEKWIKGGKRGNIDWIEGGVQSTSREEISSPVKSGQMSAGCVLPAGYEKFREVMVLRRYSPRTIKSYLGALRRAHEWFVAEKGTGIDRIGPEDAKEYFMTLMQKRSLSPSMVRICRFAIAFYFTAVVGRKIDLSFLEGMKGDRHLPTVLSREEIRRMLESTRNVKHRTMLGLLYASGVRLSECIGLRVRDISLEELVIHVKMGKGRKDRITVFSQALVEDLGKCMAGKGPADYVFTPSGGDGTAPLSGRTVQKVLEAALERAGISKKVTPHDLRHAFATHLLENGISLRHIQLLLGHKNITTTTIYTKVAHPAIRGIKSPL
jgi:site-specific recombinase XerD